MNLLAILQRLHYEAKQAGNSPSAVAGVTGRSADLLRWAISAHNDIQSARDGKWKWLLGNFYVDTVAGTSSYAYTDCTDSDAAAPISRFRAWELNDPDIRPFMYLVSDGKDTENEITVKDWPTFRYNWLRGSPTSDDPIEISIDPQNNIRVGPPPDDVFRITGTYWKSNLVLAADADTPEFPSDYHMLVVWKAITDYGYSAVAPEILALARAKGEPLYDGLVLNQAYSRFQFELGGPLA